MGRRVGTVAKADLPVVLLTVHPAVYGVTSRWFGPGSRQVIPASGSLAVQSEWSAEWSSDFTDGKRGMGENDFRAVGEIPPARRQTESLLLSKGRAPGGWQSNPPPPQLYGYRGVTVVSFSESTPTSSAFKCLI